MEPSSPETAGQALDLGDIVKALYQGLLGRQPDAGGFDANLQALQNGAPLATLIEAMAGSDEYRRRIEASRPAPVPVPSPAPAPLPPAAGQGMGADYHVPTELGRSPAMPRRALLIGSCLVEGWVPHLRSQCELDYVQFNHIARLPDEPPRPASSYDFQVVQMPLRTLLNEKTYMGGQCTTLADHQALFDRSCADLKRMLHEALQWNRRHGLTTFVCNFFTPQQNPLGRLMPRYDLRNLVFFVEQLNQRLAEELAGQANAWLLDINQVSAIHGKRWHQDDGLAVSTHHGLLGDFDFGYDQQRMEPVRPATQVYQARSDAFVACLWAEALAMFRTLRASELVKLVVTDLDDSLWRGIAAEGALDTYADNVREGWPVGVIEALQYLKKRGVLLAIASRNDEKTVERLWPQLTAGTIALADFAIRKINWKTKVENVGEILKEANLLPQNVVFVDDNPVERAAMLAAFPDMRVLGDNPYVTRRVLLWSAETQVPTISAESGRRTEMVQAQVRREGDRALLSREAFLATLQIGVRLEEITDTRHPRFGRAFELLNKTNQFNTTGKRWTVEEIAAFLREGGTLQVFDVKDIYTDYGLVGVVLLRQAFIQQWAMSCRVIGLDVEIAAMAEITAGLKAAGYPQATGEIVDTESNFICRELFKRCGFVLGEKHWQQNLGSGLSAAPTHVTVAV